MGSPGECLGHSGDDILESGAKRDESLILFSGLLILGFALD